LELLKKENIPTQGTSPNDIISGNEKMVISLLWKIIMKFHPNPGRLQEMIEINDSKTREEILNWCTNVCNKENIEISNFSSNFSNGIGLCILINLFDSIYDINKIKEESENGNIQTHINLIKNAMISGTKFNIESFIDPSSVQDGSEEFLFVLYLSQFYKKFTNPKINVKKELSSLDKTRSFFMKLEKKGEENPTTPPTVVKEKKLISPQNNEELNAEKLKVLNLTLQLESQSKEISDLSMKLEIFKIENEKLSIENEKNLKISEDLIERLDRVQTQNLTNLSQSEMEMIEKDLLIKRLIEEKSKLGTQNDLLLSANKSQEFQEKYDSFISEQDLQSEIKMLNERIEQYTKGIIKVQNKHVREMERMELENRNNLEKLSNEYEEKIQKITHQLKSSFEEEKNQIFELNEMKLETMKKAFDKEIQNLKSERDVMRMTLEDYKLDNLSPAIPTQKRVPTTMSSKAKTLLMGDNDTE
jgi:hypothetical protein